MFSLFSSSSVEPEMSPEAEETATTEEQQVAPHRNAGSKTVNSSQSTSEPSSWSEALDRYCKDNGVLRASIRVVIQEASKDVDYELPWDLPSSSELVTTIDEVVKPSVEIERAAVDSETSSGIGRMVWNGARRLGSSLVSTVFQDDLDDDDIDLNTENDAIQELSNTTSTSSSPLNWDQPIIHLAHTNHCLEAIGEAIRQLTKNEQSTIKIMEKSEWNEFCSQTNDDLLSRLPPSDLDWLLEILVRKGKAKVVRNEDLSEFVVLSSSTLPTTKENSYMDVGIALYKLKQAQNALEHRMDEWSASIQECLKKASKHKAANQTSLAIMQLKKKKLLQERIDSSASALLELEKVQSTIETTQNNHAILHLLGEGSAQLRILTEQTPLEEIDEIKGDLEENNMVANQINDALSLNSPVDEDELLAELEMMTLNDSPPLQKPVDGTAKKENNNNATQKNQPVIVKEKETRQPIAA